MQTGRTSIAVIALLGIIGAGCVSDPFIDDSIAYYDANPLSAKLNLKVVSVETIRPLSSEALVGAWSAIYTEYMRVEDGREANQLNNQSTPCVDGWKFEADGSYKKWHTKVYGGIGAMGVGTITYSDDEYGRWSYNEGVLTLNREKGESTTKQGAKTISRRNDEKRTTRQVQVVWYANNEIVLKDQEGLDLNSRTPDPNGYRTTVNFDKSGVRTFRAIHVTGVRDGRETGEVIEWATSVRFTKAKDAKSN